MKSKKNESGFTLIELLVVIGIIGILAVIAASFMTASRQSAYDITAKHDLKEFMAAQQSYFNDHQKFVGNAGDSLRNDGTPSDFSFTDLTPSPGIIITVQSGDPNNPYDPGDPFTVESRHSASTRTYTFDTIVNVITEN